MGRKLFDLNLNANPNLDKRVAIGEDGEQSENMTMQQFLDFTTTNLDVYTQAEINTLLLNYLSKTNLTVYTPTQPTHPATKGYVDDGGIIVAWASLTAGTDVTIVNGKASQVGKMITVTCEYKSAAGTFADKTVLTLPVSIGLSTVDIDFGGTNSSTSNQQGQQLYIPAGTRTIKLRNAGDDQVFYSFCVTYPAI